MAKNRHEELGLTNEDVLNIFETMVRARRIDERMWLLNRAGKIPFRHFVSRARSGTSWRSVCFR